MIITILNLYISASSLRAQEQTTPDQRKKSARTPSKVKVNIYGGLGLLFNPLAFVDNYNNETPTALHRNLVNPEKKIYKKKRLA